MSRKMNDETVIEEFDFTGEIDLRLSLEKIAERLKPMEREVLFYLMEGAEAEEIADECGVSLKSVQNIISRIRQRVKEEL